MFREQLQKFKVKFQEKNKIYLLILSLVMATLFFIDSAYLGNSIRNTLGVVDIILLGFSLFVIMIVAGYAVLKSLFFVAAEISLVVFLAQAYLGTPNHLISSNVALKSLLNISLLYIVIRFGYSLYKDLEGFYYKSIKKEPWSKWDTATAILILTFIGFYTYQIYLVISPIINDIYLKLG